MGNLFSQCRVRIEIYLILRFIFHYLAQNLFCEAEIRSQNSACQWHLVADFTLCLLFVNKAHCAAFPFSNLFFFFAVNYQVAKILTS